MLASWINAIGILVTTIGTILTLWTIIRMDSKLAGTYEELKDRHKTFRKEQIKARVGCVLIAIGCLIQIVGQFFIGRS